ncbi:MAG TPA: PKD domain-containing protein [Blastocatellia bacterium]|nr:PKD domain-containing protein [Blastocatellia bacterium]
MKVLRLSLMLVVAGVVLSSTASANTYYVATSGSNSNPGTQPLPWLTIQHAVDTIVPGDTIIVQPGSYAGCRIGKSGTLGAVCTLKASSPGAAIINSLSPANRHQSLIEVENFDQTVRYWVIDGFECVNAQRYGIDLRDTEFLTVQNCTVHGSAVTGIFLAFGYHPLIQNNESYSNGEHGIYQSNSGDFPTIRGNRLHHNFSAGLHMNGDRNFTPGDGIISFALVEKNIIWENGAPPGGGSGINCDGVSDSLIRNNLLYNNHASGISLYGIDGAEGSSRNKVYNNTIVMASDGRWCVNIPASAEGQPDPVGNDVKNNILYTPHTFRGSVSTYSNSVTGFSCDYNVVVNRFSTDGGNSNMSLTAWRALGYDQHSIIATPSQLFTNSAVNDYSLKTGSPAIDAGLALGSNVPDDILGLVRPQRLGYDIGCYEASAPSAVPLVDFAANPRTGSAPLTVQFADLSAGDPISWEWDFGDGETSNQRDPLHTYQTVGTFTVKLTAANLDGEATRSRSEYITVTPASATDYFCAVATVEVGKWLKGDRKSVRFSDDSYLKIKAPKVDGKFSDMVNYVFETALTSVSSLTVSSESRSSIASVRQQIFLFNHSTGEWDLADDRSSTGSDDSTTIVPVSNSSLYFSPSGEVRVRIRTGDVTGGKWKHYIDQVKITAAP